MTRRLPGCHQRVFGCSQGDKETHKPIENGRGANESTETGIPLLAKLRRQIRRAKSLHQLIQTKEFEVGEVATIRAHSPWIQ